VTAVWSPRAIGHLADLRAYIAREDPGAAARTARTLLAAVDRLAALPNVETAFNTELVEIAGSGTVSSVVLRSDGARRAQDIAGVFIFVGLEPNTAFVRGVVDLDPAGHVSVDAHLQTSVPGVFAAGDIRRGSAGQLASAAGDGASAAVFAARYLREH